ncbi:MAG TPA: hypothetical protein VKB07_09265 [Gaiellaceae bacterium]|nr:hypothetical protein [Gaiellaceae bacterium]
MRRLAILVAVALAAGSGCMGDDSSAIDKSELKGLVVQPSDLPNAFIRFDEGRQTRIDQPGGTLAEVDRYGRQDGWKARYRRPGSPATKGPLVVESKVDVFGDSGGAEKELAAERDDVVEGLRVEGDAPDLGDESFVATGTQGSGRFAVRSYLVAWRHENAAATVLANGFEGKFTREQAIELVRKQQARLAAAG